MKIEVVAHFSNEDGTFSPRDVVEIRDAVAHEYIKNKWAKDPSGNIYLAADGTLQMKSKVQEPVKSEVEDNIELAVLQGAPETAVGRRQRHQRRPT